MVYYHCDISQESFLFARAVVYPAHRETFRLLCIREGGAVQNVQQQ